MNTKTNQKAMTLIEILVALGIFLLATTMMWLYITNSYKIQNFSFEQSSAIEEARRGVETMTKELREALPGDNGSYPIQLAEDDELIFFADFDRDSQIEKVHYWLEGSDFKKGVTEASGTPLEYSADDEIVTTLSRYVRNADGKVFTYRDGDYNELSTPSDPDSVKLVHLFLKINVTPDRAPLDFDLESDVSIRNLKENLGS